MSQLVIVVIVNILVFIGTLSFYGSYKNTTFINLQYSVNSSSNSSHSQPLFNDSEIKTCYSLRSLILPEDIIDLDAVSPGHSSSTWSSSVKQVTFNEVHKILYGDPTTKLIYNYSSKYLNKTFDQSYPHTSLNKNIFQSIIQLVRPTLKIQFIVEVGSFTGNSASHIGQVLKSQYPGSFLLCIDTWLGDLNMWVNKVVWKHLSVDDAGRPTVYYQFLENMKSQNLTDIVLPISMTSIIGARFLRTFQFRPQIIYLDSAHEQGETLIELALYWNILQDGGVLFGDDWGWQSVRCDVKKFVYTKKLTLHHMGNTWAIQKP